MYKQSSLFGILVPYRNVNKRERRTTEMPFPTLKLVTLGLRQASKYVANFAKRRAKASPAVRGVLVKSAQGYHKLQTISKINLIGMGRLKNVKPLSEEAAIELGTEIIGDLVIIAFGLGIYVFIENRAANRKEAEKELKEEEITLLRTSVAEQGAQLNKQSVKIRELEHIIKSRSVLYDTIKDESKLDPNKVKLKL